MSALTAKCLACGKSNIAVSAKGNMERHEDKKGKRCDGSGMFASVIVTSRFGIRR